MRLGSLFVGERFLFEGRVWVIENPHRSGFVTCSIPGVRKVFSVETEVEEVRGTTKVINLAVGDRFRYEGYEYSVSAHGPHDAYCISRFGGHCKFKNDTLVDKIGVRIRDLKNGEKFRVGGKEYTKTDDVGYTDGVRSLSMDRDTIVVRVGRLEASIVKGLGYVTETTAELLEKIGEYKLCK